MKTTNLRNDTISFKQITHSSVSNRYDVILKISSSCKFCIGHISFVGVFNCYAFQITECSVMLKERHLYDISKFLNKINMQYKNEAKSKNPAKHLITPRNLKHNKFNQPHAKQTSKTTH